MDKILFVATVDQHIRHFHYPFLKWFKNNGYEVHVASNGNEELLYTDKKYNIPFERSPFKFNNIKSFRLLRKLITENDYKLVHCHTPVGGAIARLASISARKRGMKVIYTAHGFHFYKGAPKKNWILYYPIEKFLSKFTDVLITINEEDYNLAISKKFNAKRIELVNGVGINLNKFTPQTLEIKKSLREKYSYSDEDYILIYVAELSYRKHQDLLINAVGKLVKYIPNIKLLLVGDGDLYDEYSKLIKLVGVEKNVELLGYRKDVPNLMELSDVAVSSSRQEGLPVNVMEAMATGLPLVVSNCRGNMDLVEDGVNGYVIELDDLKGFVNSIEKLYVNENLRKEFGDKSIELVKKYSLENVIQEMELIYDWL